MAALTHERMSTHRCAGGWAFPVKAGVKIFAGAAVVLDAGYLAPARGAANLVRIGKASETVDNTGGAAGAVSCHVDFLKERVFMPMVGDGTFAAADVGQTAYFLDDQTVTPAEDDGGDPTPVAYSPAGMVLAIDSVNGAQRVWVEV